MLPLEQRRLARAARKAADAPDPVLGATATPETALAFYEARAASGDPFALGGVGKIDPRPGAFKP